MAWIVIDGAQQQRVRVRAPVQIEQRRKIAERGRQVIGPEENPGEIDDEKGQCHA